MIPPIVTLKKRAKKIKKAFGVKHAEALESLARTYGFKSWKILLKNHPDNQGSNDENQRD